jgi:hypothetical protein
LGDDVDDHPETISANHVDMCRFKDEQDNGYKKISGEIQSLVTTVMEGK